MPTEIIVNYFLSGSNLLLGKETYEGISEVQVYMPNARGNSVSLTRFFDGHNEHRWKIERVEETGQNELSLFLSARTDCLTEVFLSKTYGTNNTVKNAILQRGSLVEVEYGYIQSARRRSGAVGSNKRYPDCVQHSEMNKRRLAIVVNTSYPTIQVVPITSVPQDLSNGAIFEVSRDSLKDLQNYNDPSKTSYALAHMLQTVSIRRVLPPMGIFSKNGKVMRYRNVNYPHKLNRNDFKALEVAITTAVGAGDYAATRDERNTLRGKDAAQSVQIIEQQEGLEASKAINEQLTKENEAMQMLLVDWQRAMNAALTEQEALRAIQEKIREYQDIL